MTLNEDGLFPLLACAVVLSVGGATQAGPVRLSLATFVENEVAVEIVLVQDEPGRGRLVGTFTPLDPGLHLYSKDLPTHGIRGLGRPTRLQVVSSRSIKAAGALAASRPTLDLFIRPLGMKLPVYPEGPVTLSLPVSVRTDASTAAQLSVTYMACSDRICHPPVIDKRIAVTIPPRP